MNEQHMYDILRKLLDKTNVELISENIVIQGDDGRYELFGEYVISRVDGKYLVSSHKSYLEKYFFTLKNAVIWITLYKLNKLASAKRVSDLDSSLEGANFSVELNDKLSKRAKNLETKSLYIAKLVESKTKRMAIRKELDTFEQQVKAWQYQKFEQLVS